MTRHRRLTHRTNRRILARRAALASVLTAIMGITYSGTSHAVPMPKTAEAGPADLMPVFQSTTQLWDAAVALPDGRIVLQAPRWLDNPAPQLSIAHPNEAPTAYPDAAWNAADGDVAGRFVALTGMTATPAGDLWVVDSGVPDREAPPAGPARLIHIDTHASRVAGTIALDPSTLRKGSIPAGIAIHGQTAYVLDSGVAGLLVVDLSTGLTRRFFDHHPAFTAQKPIATPGGVLPARDGRPIAIDASLIAVSPDGKWLYVQAYCGPLYRIDTALFEDPDSTGAAFQEGATLWYKTGALGGLTIGPDGTLYWSDLMTHSIDSYTPGRIPHHLLSDPRLAWPGGLTVAPDGNLIVPAVQLDRAARFHNGRATVSWPATVYSVHTPADATSDVLRK